VVDAQNLNDVSLHYSIEKLLAYNPQMGHPGRVPGTRELVIPTAPFIVPYHNVKDDSLRSSRVFLRDIGSKHIQVFDCLGRP
jgi:hypothetical protein